MAIHLTEQARQDVTIGKGTIYLDSGTGELNIAGRTTPHIIPGVLYPAVAGKLLDGSTSHSGNYGTAQSDGRKYYYTDIKGSKPIKDPRIGGHFGSQRHKFKSLQLLEQETATHGSNVYSIDGREWARAVDVTSGAFGEEYLSNGTNIKIASSKEGWIEIVGYFNAVNLIMRIYTTRKSITPYINGVAGSTQNPSEASVNSPLINRYVDSGSVVSLTLPSTSLGINTLLIKDNIESNNYTNYHYGIELIAQDTSNRNNIQIPSQNVVSYGKKFNVSGTPHYDPFTTMSYGGSGTTLSALQSLIDTDTSLGMDAWKAGTSNYHRPWNGGRIIKWVDSSGVIKTSVNMMPPNAQNIGTTASNAVSDAHVIAGTNDDTINFNTSAIDHSQAEVAKTFHWREFGNGNANGGTSGTYADASMLSVAGQEIAYVMDDGLTSFSAQNASTRNNLDFEPNSNNTNNDHNAYFTFIGTGLTLTASQNGAQTTTVVQNLPYGTHVYNHFYQADSHAEGKIDGVALGDTMSGTYGDLSEVTFHQPKRPPIPEDACVLADYMLMADWVNSDSGTIGTIPKGAREVSPSRDLFYDSDGSLEHFYSGNYSSGWFFGDGGSEATINTNFAELPVFGTRFHVIGYDMDTRSDLYVDGSIATSSGTTGGNHSTYLRLTNPESNLGVHKFRVANKANGRITFGNFFVDSPIHTSSHYQSFETPFLHELVGGDRNMEQTNLVCSPDGKTWDEVTRDTSYLGNLAVCTVASGSTDWGTFAVCDAWRGTYNSVNYFNKYFAIAYDRLICLVDGQYEFTAVGRSNTGGSLITWNINDTHATLSISSAGLAGIAHHVANLKKGDVVAVQGEFGTDSDAYNVATIKKV